MMVMSSALPTEPVEASGTHTERYRTLHTPNAYHHVETNPPDPLKDQDDVSWQWGDESMFSHDSTVANSPIQLDHTESSVQTSKPSQHVDYLRDNSFRPYSTYDNQEFHSCKENSKLYKQHRNEAQTDQQAHYNNLLSSIKVPGFGLTTEQVRINQLLDKVSAAYESPLPTVDYYQMDYPEENKQSLFPKELAEISPFPRVGTGQPVFPSPIPVFHPHNHQKSFENTSSVRCNSVDSTTHHLLERKPSTNHNYCDNYSSEKLMSPTVNSTNNMLSPHSNNEPLIQEFKHEDVVRPDTIMPEQKPYEVIEPRIDIRPQPLPSAYSFFPHSEKIGQYNHVVPATSFRHGSGKKVYAKQERRRHRSHDKLMSNSSMEWRPTLSYDPMEIHTDYEMVTPRKPQYKMSSCAHQETSRNEKPRSNQCEALLALPVFKQESLDYGFQYILNAATSPATKLNEDTLTYLNQGQSYEVKLKTYGNANLLKSKKLTSVARVLFHERRLQFMEKEQIDYWKKNRPGERILDLDVPLSYRISDIKIDPALLNCFEFSWEPNPADVGVYIKVNCISTEFTAKKHGGEKGVPFKIQIDTYENETNSNTRKLIYSASSQIKVFKPKGADRKHKTDREKMEKRTEAEKQYYRPSYTYTILSERSLDPEPYPQQSGSSQLSNSPAQITQANVSDGSPDHVPPGVVNTTTVTPAVTPAMPRSNVYSSVQKTSPVTTDILSVLQTSLQQTTLQHSDLSNERPFQFVGKQTSTPVQPSTTDHLSSILSTPSPDSSVCKQVTDDVVSRVAALNTPTVPKEREIILTQSSNAQDVTKWLHANRFSSHVHVFQNFAGSDLLRLSRDDLIQICGLADGIRLNNALQSKTVRPRLTIYICQEPQQPSQPHISPHGNPHGNPTRQLYGPPPGQSLAGSHSEQNISTTMQHPPSVQPTPSGQATPKMQSHRRQRTVSENSKDELAALSSSPEQFASHGTTAVGLTTQQQDTRQQVGSLQQSHDTYTQQAGNLPHDSRQQDGNISQAQGTYRQQDSSLTPGQDAHRLQGPSTVQAMPRNNQTTNNNRGNSPSGTVSSNVKNRKVFTKPTVVSVGNSIHNNLPPITAHSAQLNAPALKSKRTLGDDDDDEQEQQVIGSTKKQRTRCLEMFKKAYHALYLEDVTVNTLVDKIANLYSITSAQIIEAFMYGPANIMILVTDDVVANFTDLSLYAVDAVQDEKLTDKYRLIIRSLD